MVFATSSLAGSNDISRLHAAFLAAVVILNAPELNMIPRFPKRIPYPFPAQLTLFAGCGVNGQSPATKVAQKMHTQIARRSHTFDICLAIFSIPMHWELRCFAESIPL